MRHRLKFIWFVLCLTPLARAQDIQQDSVQYLPEVVVTDRTEEQLLSLIVAGNLKASALQNFGPSDIAFTMNQIPGVHVLSGALNTNRITIRGVGARTPFGTDKLRMYYNNIPVTNGTGVSTLEAFDLENLSGITVVKGPKSSAFGSALGGTILLNSESQSGNWIRNNLHLGSYGLVKDNFTANVSSENWDLRASYNYLDTDGYRENNYFDRQGLLLDIRHEISAKHEIGLLMNYLDYTAGIPSSLGLTAYQDDPQQAAFTWAQSKGFEDNNYLVTGLTHRWQVSERLTSDQTVFYSYLDHYEPRPFNILDEYTNTYGMRSVFNLEMGRLESTPLTFGFELFRDIYNWKTYENLYRSNNGNGSLQGMMLSRNKEFRGQFFAFSSVAFTLAPSFRALLGINANRTAYDYRDQFNEGTNNRSAEKKFQWILLPNLNLEYDLGQQRKIFASISRGFSNPGLEETLTPEGVINPDIEQEKGIQYELGMIWNSADKNWHWEISIFRMDIKDLLVADRVGEDQFIGRNAGTTLHRGFEFSLDRSHRLSEDLTWRTAISYTYADHKFQSFIDEEEDYSGNELTGVPRHRLNAYMGLSKSQGFTTGLTYQYVDRIPLTDANTLYSESYGIWGAKAGIRLVQRKNLNIRILGGVNNVFDKLYAQSVLINAVGFGGNEPRYYYPGNGRNYYLNFEITLN